MRAFELHLRFTSNNRFAMTIRVGTQIYVQLYKRKYTRSFIFIRYLLKHIIHYLF